MQTRNNPNLTSSPAQNAIGYIVLAAVLAAAGIPVLAIAGSALAAIAETLRDALPAIAAAAPTAGVFNAIADKSSPATRKKYTTALTMTTKLRDELQELAELLASKDESKLTRLEYSNRADAVNQNFVKVLQKISPIPGVDHIAGSFYGSNRDYEDKTTGETPCARPIVWKRAIWEAENIYQEEWTLLDMEWCAPDDKIHESRGETGAKVWQQCEDELRESIDLLNLAERGLQEHTGARNSATTIGEWEREQEATA